MKKEKTTKLFKKDFVVLFFILAIALLLRIWNIGTPLADFHSWRQVDTASVGRTFTRQGFNLMKPQFHDFSNIQSGKDNPEGLRMVEFPLYNASFALLYKYFPITSLEIYARGVSIFFSLILIFVIYYFLLRESGRFSAIVGSSLYATFPFFVFFSRVVLPETTALSLTFLSLFFAYLFASAKTRIKNLLFFTLSLALFASALLIKPMVIFFAISHFYLFISKYRWDVLKKTSLYLFFIFAVLPLALWRLYIQSFPEGIPANDWLITGVNTPQGLQSIFFRPSFFRWIFYERINNIILGGFLTPFLILGALAKQKKLFLYSILISTLTYLFVFQGGNVQHEYYQTLILPALAIYVALGVNLIYENVRIFTAPVISAIVIILSFGFSFFISFYTVKDYYSYSGDLVSIAKIVKDLTAPEDKIVTDTIGDTTLLYLSDRKGSPAPYKDFHDFARENYKYFITLNKDVATDMKAKGEFDVVFENDKLTIFAL